MSLLEHIPKDFYRIFRTKNREYYIEILVELYRFNMEEYSGFGLTRTVCKQIINETIASKQMVWQEDEEEADQSEGQMELITPSARSFSNLLQWGWLKSDYDEMINEYVISFPDYSQMFVELFQRLMEDGENPERESILAIYSLLYTFQSDKDRNNDILKNAWNLSRKLVQLLTNMQDGMRTYFDELSEQKNFLGIQQVLIQELNNSDSKRYAFLTTTDSFYRYKEQVKELISQILDENEGERLKLQEKQEQEIPDSDKGKYMKRQMRIREETSEYIIRIEREFDTIEKKYNRLIEQKSIFAQRALARVRYILQEGVEESENIVSLINRITQKEDGDEILEELRDRLPFSNSFVQFNENSFYQKRVADEKEFTPQPVKEKEEEEFGMTEFVPAPLYSGKELRDFREKNTVSGRFQITEDSIESAEDLEKLMLLWQQVTAENQSEKENIILGEELQNKDGLRFTQLTIEEDTDV